MSQNNVKEILTKYRTVTIVGISQNSSKDSYKVAKYLMINGFHIMPINPFATEILGKKCYKSLAEMPIELQKTMKIVDIFRPAEDVLPIVEQAIQLKKLHGTPYVIWMQLGITNEEAAEKARKSGLTVIMDKCIMQEHKRLFTSTG